MKNDNQKPTDSAAPTGEAVGCSVLLAEAISEEFKEAERLVLDYTCSDRWEQIENLEWTTAEMLEVIEKLLQSRDRYEAKWKSVATAPKDGVFLAFQPHDMDGFSFAACINTLGNLACAMTGEEMPNATHWKPIGEYPQI